MINKTSKTVSVFYCVDQTSVGQMIVDQMTWSPRKSINGQSTSDIKDKNLKGIDLKKDTRHSKIVIIINLNILVNLR